MRMFACLLAVLWITGCSSTPVQQAAAPPPKADTPPEAVTGRTAFWKMFTAARIWAPDVQALRLRSIRMSEIKDEAGKAGAWEALFYSPSKQRQRAFTYSVVEGPGNLHKDVFAGLEEAYRPNPQMTPWVIQAFRIDSDAAYETAAKKSEAYMKKHPEMPLTFLLEQTKRHPYLTWRVVWGESVSTSGYSIFVNASTGDYLETGR